MKVKPVMIIGLIVAVVAVGGVVAVTRARPHRHAAAGAAQYYCPMHPTYTSDRPGDCPICNMKLVKRETQAETNKSDKPGQSPMGVAPAETPPGYTPILVTPQKQQLIGVKTASVARRAMTKTIRAVGRIAYDPELAVAQQEYVQSLVSYEKATAAPLPEITAQAASMVEASRRKLRLLGMSAEQIAALQQSGAAQTNLYLPAAGQPVWVYAQIYEYELGLVQPGMSISVEAVGFPGETFAGVVAAIDPVVDPMTRTVKLRAMVPNPDGKLKPEMYVNVTLAANLGEQLAVPEEAVFDTGTRRIIFVDKGQGLFEPRDVTVGVKADGYYEVKDGLAEGESVVTSGNFLIDSESRLKAALEGAGGGAHQHGQ